jgi:hypothetical protein
MPPNYNANHCDSKGCESADPLNQSLAYAETTQWRLFLTASRKTRGDQAEGHCSGRPQSQAPKACSSKLWSFEGKARASWTAKSTCSASLPGTVVLSWRLDFFEWVLRINIVLVASITLTTAFGGPWLKEEGVET